MDRFKFRTWDKIRHKMRKTFNLIERLEYLGQSTYGLTYMQCTGLKDKHGKLIFEGDVIESRSEIRGLYDKKSKGIAITRYEVRWESNEGRWGRFNHKKEKFELLSGLNQDYMTKWYEIIGNIYENGDLLNNS
jgi:uncharacterized phage protein (TIGR01671 family)